MYYNEIYLDTKEHNSMQIKLSAEVESLQDRNATVALVRYGGFSATGSAKRNKEEPFDARAGRLLATARAFRALSREIEKSVKQ